MGDNIYEHGGAQEKMSGQASEIPLEVQVGKQDKIKGKMEPKRTALESSSAGTGVEAPEQPRLSCR